MVAKRKYRIFDVGERVGRLVITGYERGIRGGLVKYKAVCACGETATYDPHNLYNGKTTRCDTCGRRAGLQTREKYSPYRGIMPSPHRERWLSRYSAMCSRCTDPTNAAFQFYGARDVAVYEPWIKSSAEFLAYICTIPGWDEPQLTMDRVDPHGGYQPGNIRLVSIQEQQHNKRTTRWVEYAGCRMSATEFWRRHCTGFKDSSCVFRRLDAGQTPDEIVAASKSHPRLRRQKCRPKT